MEAQYHRSEGADPETASPASAEIRLLGEFETIVDGRELHMPLAAQQTIALIALNSRRVSRHIIAAALWPEKTDTRAAANLRSTLWRMPEAATSVVVADKATGLLSLGADVTVDIERLGLLCETLHSGVDGAAADGGLLQQPLLLGWYDDWVIEARERVAHRQLRAMTDLAMLRLANGDFGGAIDLALHLVNLDPLRDASQRALIASLLAEGSFGAARYRLAAYQSLLVDSFGSEASCPFHLVVEDGQPRITDRKSPTW